MAIATKRRHVTDMVSWEDVDNSRVWDFIVEFSWEDHPDHIGLDAIGFGSPIGITVTQINGYVDEAEMFCDLPIKPFWELAGHVQILAVRDYLQKHAVDSKEVLRACHEEVCGRNGLYVSDYT